MDVVQIQRNELVFMEDAEGIEFEQNGSRVRSYRKCEILDKHMFCKYVVITSSV